MSNFSTHRKPGSKRMRQLLALRLLYAIHSKSLAKKESPIVCLLSLLLYLAGGGKEIKGARAISGNENAHCLS